MSTVVTPELVARYDRPGPRYTSYPTAVEFSEGFGPDDHAQRLAQAATRAGEPLALYIHLPFCESRCSFCGCHVVIARRPEVADAYLEHVVAEASIVAEHLGERTRLNQYHLGGGTPTYHSPDVLADLHRALLSRFEVTDDAELAVEVDPRTTTSEHLDMLRELGFNRLSMGIQDTDTTVQDLIGRNQTWEQSERAFRRGRELGFESINTDLIYGLPGQNEKTFDQTLDHVTELMPDRLALYSFAYVPWVRSHQKRIDADDLPDRDLKFALLSAAVERLTSAGYRQIGMDHFALPTDVLAQAQDQGELWRTFMGYTAGGMTDTVALGTSGISDISGAYAQNHKRLASYYESVNSGELPIERGVALSDDDLVRRFVITEIMCNNQISLDEVSKRFQIDAPTHFATEIERLHEPEGLIDEGLVELDGNTVSATDIGRPFIRNVAMVFDAYLPSTPTSGVFSRTV